MKSARSKEITGMEESTTYQWILAQGAIKEARKILTSMGREHFGSPDAETRAALEAITDLEYLETSIHRVAKVSSWRELLATPPVCYQWIMSQGKLEELRRVLTLQGRKRFGPLDAKTATVIEDAMDIEHLEKLAQRLLEVSSWQELLAGPPT